jgi:transposase
MDANNEKDIEQILDEVDDLLDEDELEHYGTPRHSGRYPWGSGENPYQRYADFLGNYETLKKKGLTPTEIAKSMNMTTTVMRAKISVANAELRKERVAMAMKLKEKGYSAPAIARRMGLPSESSVRSLLNEESKRRTDQLSDLMQVLRNTVDEKKYVDVGGGSELRLNVSEQKLKNACELLKEEGYKITPILQQQGGTSFKTTVKVLTKDDVTKKEIREHQDEIAIPNYYSEDHGYTIKPIERPVPINGDRIMVRYAEEGGKERDGTLELRRGVKDLDLHNALYAQVRVMVRDNPDDPNGTHYLKGMAIYSPDEKKMPPGVDIIVNSNKPKGTALFGESSDTSVFKPVKKDADPDNPFGATVKEDDKLIRAQRHYIGDDGQEHLSALNIVNEEGNWNEWSKTLSSQFLAKQRPELIRSQLKEAYDIRKDEFDEIRMMTNKAVQQKLLDSFADDCDAAAVHLKGASMPRQRSQVILPMPWLKEDECFAPNYQDGETVVCIRYPHAGLFEIAELRVNNGDKKAREMLRRPDGSFAVDAIGIHPKAAQKLSGADFDGDSVLVIPNNDRRIMVKPMLDDLKSFDPDQYQLQHDAPKVDKAHGFNKQREMGDISNLITDMTIKGAGANMDEIARAVKHSMVVIDAEKHHLDWRKSALDNGIAELKEKYQGGARRGASTLISRAKGQAHPMERKLLTNPAKMTKEQRERFYNGEQIWVETNGTHFTKAGKEVANKMNTTKMEDELARTGSSFGLSSGTIQETLYANFANKLHSLANEARKASRLTTQDKRSPSAARTYAKEVKDLSDKLYLAELNRPLERKAQLLMGSKLKSYIKANPDMDNDELKKLRGRLIKECRQIVGAKKNPVDITDREWEAIQAHAVSYNTLKKILNNTDMDHIKQLSMPRSQPVMSNAKISRARTMLNQGRTTAEIAEALDVSISTLQKALL